MIPAPRGARFALMTTVIGSENRLLHVAAARLNAASAPALAWRFAPALIWTVRLCDRVPAPTSSPSGMAVFSSPATTTSRSALAGVADEMPRARPARARARSERHDLCIDVTPGGQRRSGGSLPHRAATK